MSNTHHNQIVSVIPELEIEEWKPVPTCEGYDASNLGRIRSWLTDGPSTKLRSTPKILSVKADKDGYRKMHVRVGHRKYKLIFAHHLVLEAFVGPRPELMICRHLDGNPSNNRIDNLKWGTAVENKQDDLRNGVMVPAKPVKQTPFILFADPFISVEAIIPLETWKEIPDHDSYEVSNMGNLRCLSFGCRGGRRFRKNPRNKKLTTNIHGYLYTNLNGKISFIHRVVIETFSPRPSRKSICRHLDGNRKNNHISNLRWGTYQENKNDSIFHGTYIHGERHPRSKLTDDKVREIRVRLKQGERACDLAREFGITESGIRNIKIRVNWKHVQ